MSDKPTTPTAIRPRKKFFAHGANVCDNPLRPDLYLAFACSYAEDPAGVARMIADALNQAQEFPWIGDGPTVEEAGAESILVRLGTDLHRATWAWHVDHGQGWKWQGTILGSGEATPTGWRPMPK